MNKDYTKLKDFAQKRLDDSCRNDDDYDIRYWVGYIDGLNALQKKLDGDTAIEALEKQIPKKITHEATLQRCATCPTCKNVLDEFIEFIPGQPKIRVTFAHCYFCGQALDWSENND